MSVINDIVFTDATDHELYKGNHKFISIKSIDILNDSISELYEIKMVFSFIYDPNSKTYRFLNGIDINSLLGKTVQFYFSYEGNKKKYFSGMIDRILVSQKNSKIELDEFTLILKPFLYLLTKNKTSRAWVGLNTKDIIEAVLSKYSKYIKFSFDIKRNKDHIKQRINTVQYNQTDYEFLCRLLHEEGLNFIIEQLEGQGSDGYTSQNVCILDDAKSYFDKNKQEATKINVSTEFFDYNRKVELSSYEISSTYDDAREFKTDKEIHFTRTEFVKNALFQMECNPNLNNSTEVLEVSSAYVQTEYYRRTCLNETVFGTDKLNVLSLGQKIKFSFRDNYPTYLNPKEHYLYSLNHKYIKQNTLKHYNYEVEISAFPAESANSNETLTYIHDYKVTKVTPPSSINAFIYADENNAIKRVIGNEKEGAKNPGELIAITLPWQNKNEKTRMDKSSPFIWARATQIQASENSGIYIDRSAGTESNITFNNGDIEQPVINAAFTNSIIKIPKEISNGIYIQYDSSELTRTIAMKISEKIKDEDTKSVSILKMDNKNFKVNITDNKNASDLQMNHEGSLITKVTKEKTNSKLNLTGENIYVGISQESNISEIEMKSNGNAELNTSNDINLITKKNIKIKSDDTIDLNSNQADITVNNSANIKGKSVNINKVKIS